MRRARTLAPSAPTAPRHEAEPMQLLILLLAVLLAGYLLAAVWRPDKF